MEVNDNYEETSRKVYTKQSYVAGENAIAAAILVLAEAIRYHADVTAPLPTREFSTWPGPLSERK